jgi:formate dehydrogenase assembly factor FdhD
LTGFLFSEGIVRSFKAIVSISIIATANIYEQIEVRGLQMSPGTWIISESRIGDDTNVDLSIISSGGNGQIQYTSTNISGFVSSLIKIVSKEVTTI